jgi:hypothetical protein
MRLVALVAVGALAALAGCSHAVSSGSTIALRPACGSAEYWDGRACKKGGDAPQQLAISTEALARLDIDKAKAALDRVEAAGPLDHTTNVSLWEQRGIAAAYTDDEASATKAFDMMLALDPTHFLSYQLSPKATLVFDKTLQQAKLRGTPEIDVTWPHDRKVGDPIPVDVEVLADPKRFLSRATLFVRTRGERSWRAADLPLTKERHIVLPPVTAEKDVSLELYLRAYDQKGNEVLTWNDPARPREIALPYVPPPPWYKTKWGITGIVVGATAIVGSIVYAVTLAPPDKIGADVSVKQ